jgi:predicted nucleotidyltransferase
MMNEFNTFVGNRMLGWFLAHPTKRPHINQLARELGISPASVKRYADLFVRDGILTEASAGTARLLSLDNDTVMVKEMKRLYMVILLLEAGITGIARTAISLVMYGSASAGTFDEQSDIDILVLGNENDVDFERVAEIEGIVGHELQVTVIPCYRWEEMKQRGDAFVAGVISRHVLFQGAEP